MIEFADAAMSLAGILAVQRTAETPLPCRHVVLDAAGLRALPPQAWDDLSTNALECNPWLSRPMVLAGLDALEKENGFRALALYRHGSDELIGLLPFRIKGLGPLSMGHPALNLYQVGGTPLIARDNAQLAMMGLFGLIAGPNSLPNQWVFPHIPTDGPFARMARVKADRLGLAVGIAAAYDRPLLTSEAGDFAAHARHVIGKKRSKDIERNIRRLGEKGALSFERATDPNHVAQRIEDFLRIEASGWKGERGTAFLSNPDHARFARGAYGEGLAFTDTLLLDGTAIAVSVNVATGPTVFTPKCAFDERYRAFGPGMILEYKVIERFFAEGRHEAMDAATTVDGHVISGLWDAKKPMGTLVVARSRLAADAICGTIDGVLRAKAGLKRFLRRG